MKSRELGLVLAQQLTGVEDLHYGYWDPGAEPQLSDLKMAQARYSQFLIEAIEHCTPAGSRILDVGCGTGHLLVQLLDRGYRVDGLIPDEYLEAQVRARLNARSSGYRPRIFTDRFEGFKLPDEYERYHLLLFSESFQYIPYVQNIPRWPQLLNTDGSVMICDFFRSLRCGDGGPGDGTFRGGHQYAEFMDYLDVNGICVLRNDDITARTSPTIRVLDDLLMGRLKPAMVTLDQYVSERRPWLTRLVKWVARRPIRRIQTKYLSGHRSQEVFERYKTYRLMVLKLP